MRTRIALSFFLLAGTSAIGCAHSAPVEAEAPSDYEAQITRLRQDNATLRKEVAHLEERVRILQSAGDREHASAGPGGRDLPVVRLAPPKPDEPEKSEPEYIRHAVTLSPVPHSSPYDTGYTSEPSPEREPEGQPSGWSQPELLAAAEPEVGDSGVKSYRLVGSRLVDLTRKKRPKPRPAKSQKSRSRRGKSKKGKKSGGAVVAQYDEAMSVYKDGRFAEAERAFDAIVARYPGHDYADNALYWKGEAAYDQAHYADALAAFTEVVERYGGGNKAPDALLKIGLCYGKLGDTANAKDVLTQLIAAYPKARATKIAHDKLAQF